MDASVLLMTAAAAIIGVLGVVHLVYTFKGPKLTPRDPDLARRMRETSPVITRHTTMWNTWIGFNASHSLCAIQFALVFGYLAQAHPALLFGSPALLAIAIGLLATLLAIGLRYWFRIPNTGIALALACAVASVALAAA
jgi:hypothetical protein